MTWSKCQSLVSAPTWVLGPAMIPVRCTNASATACRMPRSVPKRPPRIQPQLPVPRGDEARVDVDAVRVHDNGHTTKHAERATAVSSQDGRGVGRERWQPHPRGAKPRDVIEIPVIRHGMAATAPHATQKPAALIA